VAKGKVCTLTIKARNVMEKNMYIKAMNCNGKIINSNWLKHYDLFRKNSVLGIGTSNMPNRKIGAHTQAFPESVTSVN
jgi:putative alpha-1,2-mannosidase